MRWRAHLPGGWPLFQRAVADAGGSSAKDELDFRPRIHSPRAESAAAQAGRVLGPTPEARGALAAGMTSLPIRHEFTTLLFPVILARLHRTCSRAADLEAFDGDVLGTSRQQLLNLVQQRLFFRRHQ